MDATQSEPTLALFIDFENLALGVREGGAKIDLGLVLERLVEKGRVIARRAYSDWTRYSDHRKKLHELGIDLTEVPQRRQGGKNSADIRMVVDAMEMCYEKPHVQVFVIASGDSDFSPLVNKLRENAKEVIGVGMRGSTSDLLVECCDEFIFYEDLVASRTKRRGDDEHGSLPKRLKDVQPGKAKAFTYLLDAVQALMRENKQVLWGSMIKETIRRKRPSFDEGQHGYSNFSRLLEDMQRHNLLKLKRDELSGGYIVVAVADDVL